MFSDLLRRLTGAAPAALPDTDARLALAALLVRVARTDGRYDSREQARIERILGRRYRLTPLAARTLRGEAEILEEEAPDTVRFTRAVKAAVPLEERRAVIEAMWDVALADEARAPEEDALLRLVASLLGLSDVESAQARQRADRNR